ncbi:MAG: fluoride efflux transporter CrcB [Rikenellaceae bacterium]|nr:fluoride efflux transporter CrcB [Rikenellaceae bacterium]
MQNMHTVGNILWVGVGGFVGSTARYSVGLLFQGIPLPGRWPWATFLVNLVGSFLIGLLWGKFLQQPDERILWTLGIAGFCGGFTTFSSFSFEVLELLKSGAAGTALAYLTASLGLCLGAVWCALMLMKS